MHGGMKIYAGAPAAARQYVEADRGRADDYYLTEGAGVARRFSVTEGRVTELAPLTGDAYETWGAGRDPGTGEPRGQLRGDGHAVRFVEVVVNGPKTWSLAAVLHPDIAQAYDAAQDRAVEQIIGWLGRHATTRVGPRGGQVQVPVVGLRVVDVDFMRGVVRPVQQRDGEPLKSETSRTPLPIPSELALELSAAVARWGGDYVVTDGAGRQSSTWAIERAVRAARPKIGGYRRDSASTTSGTTWHRSSLAAA